MRRTILILVGALIVALAISVAWAGYTRDASGSDMKALLIALEYVIKDEDAAHASADCGVQMLAVRKDTQATTAGHDGDYGPPQMNATGALRVEAAPASAPSAAVAAVHFAETVDAAGTAQPILAASTVARTLMIMAKKVTGDNTGIVYLGIGTGVDKTNMQIIALAPGEYWEPNFKAPIDLNTIYVDAATTDDGVVGIYQP